VLFGFPYAGPLLVFAYLHFSWHEKWYVSIRAAVFAWTVLHYLFGVVLGTWGILKIKDNVLNPQQTPIWEAVSRLAAAGCFFALPFVITVAKNTVGALILPFMTTTYTGATTGDGLDTMMVRFMADIYGPMLFIMNFFGYIAGTVLVMIGISRLIKSAQEGPRGPGGLGTMMTFLTRARFFRWPPWFRPFRHRFSATPRPKSARPLNIRWGCPPRRLLTPKP